MEQNQEKKQDKTYPLVIVFYLDREMMQRQEIIRPFADSINNMINVKNFNAMALFLPTYGEERVECINPIITPKEEMDKIEKLIEEIKSSFNINEKLEGVPDEDIIIEKDEEQA